VCTDAEQATRNGAAPVIVKLIPDRALKPIVTDAERLRMALVNILANARQAVLDRDLDARRSKLEAGNSNLGAESPDIEIQTMNGTAGHVSVIVRDRGMGVKPEDLPRVFDPYFTTKRTGSGLGLAIAKNIIEGMGGSIALESRVGHGTEIRIDLPSQAPPAARSTQGGRA